MSKINDYNEEFDKLRKNRIEMAHYKYGPAKINFGDGLVNAMETMNNCVAKYKETGNTEYLLDAANYLMFEFTYSKHPNAHFKATDSCGSAGTVGKPYNQMMNEMSDTLYHVKEVYKDD